MVGYCDADYQELVLGASREGKARVEGRRKVLFRRRRSAPLDVARGAGRKLAHIPSLAAAHQRCTSSRCSVSSTSP